jgi:hypothetical protein
MLQENGHSDVEATAGSLAVARDYAGRLTSVEAEEGTSGLLGLGLLGGEAIIF